MAISDLFKLNFKKPTLSAEEAGKEEKKTQISSLFEKAFSRLESVELLNANGKIEESTIISRLLALDLVNLGLAYCNKPSTNLGKDWSSDIQTLGNETLIKIYEKFPEVLALAQSEVSTDLNHLEDLESKLNSLLASIESFFNKMKRTELQTPLSNQKLYLRLQGGFVLFLIISISSTILYRKIKYPDLLSTEVKVYFMSKVEPGPLDQNASASKIQIDKKGEWVDYDLTLPKAVDVTEVRIDPTEQARIRLALQHLKFFDAKGKNVYTHEFVWAEDLLPKDKMSYGVISELKMAGKSIVGQSIEMETIGGDPFFHVRLPEIKGVTKAQLRIRHIEIAKKFK
ncbi:MAG: hypothetical protein SH817_01675 [Leptospira sp.]|nr:hypothetical protein [Leptospira sp.]